MVSIAVKKGRDNVAMLGIGAYRPQRVVSNDEVCEVLDSTDQWIYERTGIRNRRWISGDETLRSIAAAAGDRALNNTGIDRSKIGALILCTSSWLKLTPHGAPTIAADLGINGIPAFDLTSGCGGFGYGLGVAADLIRAGSAEYVLVIGAETMTVGLDPTDRGTAMIFGDGAGAVVVGPSEENGISPTVWGSDGENAEAIAQDVDFLEFMNKAQAMQGTDPAVEPIGRMSLRMEGPKVFRWAAVTLPRALADALDASGVSKEDIEVFVPHQANARINELMKKNLGLAEDIPMANDIENTGNTSAASIPLAMEEMLVTGKAKGGQLALLLGFGAGLSYAGQVVTLPPKPAEPSF
ncbi:beta-ketoacyl-ACP synthase III [Nocardia cyriacigeorgica]|uniref:3-oxoacyl-CoA synthase n=2 Tax=Nocardia cyriacigeorgica TaxID=135487 RepID=H6R776_NOCCG|nr:beta-ketoacyl-ACP synthase 3 [Nocardia cyriacigeorgica]MBF6284965.1 beta-ketoacyl-ACP synthase 3 [Nocardia cyriacigeorgica]MBF6426580.1 beta-ketoacyl-ACP synthase 3 [Nocardia cyriacigeorgica]NEW35368.1 beta-ketoacyl-ACP synthase III [Nocardia cyriacigeorgica]CCF65994.1 3-oxoacyl-CoA synthase [Nocardia cyriacigeorgica GUH-2]BDT89690.1 3-oxoacyl-[acyl-carrier-protein] synthase 3 [Nocardia cyriacigeorgica]